MNLQAPDHAHEQELARMLQRRADRRAQLIGWGRLAVCLLLAVPLVALRLPPWLFLCDLALVIGIFMLAGVLMSDLRRARLVATRLGAYHRDGCERQAGRWGRASASANGLEACPEHHPFARDLGIVGERSLFTLLDTSATTSGRALLLSWLLDTSGAVALERADEVRYLSTRHAWRARFYAEGADQEGLGADQLGAWLKLRRVPPRLLGACALVARILVLGVIGLISWHATSHEIALVILISAIICRSIDVQSKRFLLGLDGDSLYRMVTAERALLERIAELPDSSAPPDGLRAAMAIAQQARIALRRCQSLSDGLSKHANPIWSYLVGALWFDLTRQAARFDRWAVRYGDQRPLWLQVAARVDAHCCLATYVAEQGGCWPQWSEDGASYRATALAHPLLAASQRVGNDIEIPQSLVLVVTGANASGKSTFLRACLLSVLMARVGLTVCASSLTLRSLRIACAMGARDDIHQGLSRFQAEVKRLRTIIDEVARPGPPVLVALDEVLSGTNSTERHQGTRAVVLTVRQQAAAVLISTHDLALAEMEHDTAPPVAVVHFADRTSEEGASPDLAFDYLMRPGVLTSTNALRLLRLAGIHVG